MTTELQQRDTQILQQAADIRQKDTQIQQNEEELTQAIDELQQTRAELNSVKKNLQVCMYIKCLIKLCIIINFYKHTGQRDLRTESAC